MRKHGLPRERLAARRARRLRKKTPMGGLVAYARPRGGQSPDRDSARQVLGDSAASGPCGCSRCGIIKKRCRRCGRVRIKPFGALVQVYPSGAPQRRWAVPGRHRAGAFLDRILFPDRSPLEPHILLGLGGSIAASGVEDNDGSEVSHVSTSVNSVHLSVSCVDHAGRCRSLSL